MLPGAPAAARQGSFRLSGRRNCSWEQQKPPWKAERGPRCQQAGLVPQLEYGAATLLVIVSQSFGPARPRGRWVPV